MSASVSAGEAGESLFDDVVRFENVLRAARAVTRGKRHTAAAQHLLFDLEPIVLRLVDQLNSGRWRPSAYRVFTVREPKQRQIAAAPIEDRIVHHAVCNVVGPILEESSIGASFACRVGKGTHRAVSMVRRLARTNRYYLKSDVRRFFDSVDHAALQRLLRVAISDDRLMELLDRIVEHPTPGAARGKGLPIGNLTSQHFANFYLSALDRAMQACVGEGRYLRYMDDFLLFANDPEVLHRARSVAARALSEELQLELKQPGTFVAPVSEGVPFVGMRVFRGVTRLRHGGWSRFARRWRLAVQAGEGGERGNRRGDVLSSAQSLLGHVRHASTWKGRKRVCDAPRG